MFLKNPRQESLLTRIRRKLKNVDLGLKFMSFPQFIRIIRIFLKNPKTVISPKTLAKANVVLNFTVYFTQVKALTFSLKHMKNKLKMVENSVRIIQYLTFYHDVTFFLFLFSFN